jgi:3-hydroxybutyrate dehydrogenase
MKNRNAPVTGSTSGIGLATARELANRGCHVMINGFGERQEIDRLCAEIAARSGTKVIYSGAVDGGYTAH